MNELRPIDKPWTSARPGDVLAVTNCYDEIMLALRTWAQANNFAYLDLDYTAGLTTGHCSKFFGPGCSRTISPLTLHRLLKALKLKIAIVAEEMPIPSRPKNHSQDRHPLNSPHLPPRDGSPHSAA